jgi:hypothetical protein
VTRDHSPQAAATAAISPTEAICRAMAVLGSNSQVPEILDYIREHFGITGVAPAEDGLGNPLPPLSKAPAAPQKPTARVEVAPPPAKDVPQVPLVPIVPARTDANSTPAPVKSEASANPQVPRPLAEPVEAGDAADSSKKGAGKRPKPKDRPS